MYFIFLKSSLHKIKPITMLLSALQETEDFTALSHFLLNYKACHKLHLSLAFPHNTSYLCSDYVQAKQNNKLK